MNIEKIEVDNFKELIINMNSGFPNYTYRGIVEKVVKTENIRNHLIKNGVLVQERINSGKHEIIVYSLGINGIRLANSYLTDKQTKEMINLTKYIAGLTLAMLLLVFLQIAILIFN